MAIKQVNCLTNRVLWKIVTLTWIVGLFPMKTIEERKSILDKDVFRLVNHGWRVAHSSDTKCLLVKDKKANGCLLIVLLLLFIVPGIIYLIMYKGRSTLKIEVTEKGDIKYFPTGLSTFEINELESYWLLFFSSPSTIRTSSDISSLTWWIPVKTMNAISTVRAWLIECRL